MPDAVIEEVGWPAHKMEPSRWPIAYVCDHPIPHVSGPCRECGTPSPYAHYVPETRDRMLAMRLCFNCLFWTDVLTERSRHVVIDGTAFAIGREPPVSERGSWGLGFGGQRCVIERFDGTVVTSHNLWCRGAVPLHFRTRLPDDAKWGTHA